MTEYGQSNEVQPSEVITQAEENIAVDRGLQPKFTPDLGRLRLDGNIILGNFILNQMDNFGNAWVVREIEGWWATPDADVPEISRSEGDGSYEVAGRFASRTITIEGSILPSSPSNIEAARDRLVQATNLVRQGAWFKTGSNPIRASFVYLVSEVSAETVNLQGRTDFEITLRAADPIKYAWNDASPDGYETFEIPAKNSANAVDGTGVIENIGNYPVPVFLEVSGPFTGPGTIFNKTTQELIIITQGLKGPISRSVVNKQLAFDVDQLKDVATLTTTEAHEFSEGDSVFISGIGAPFDGDRLITATPTDTTFTFDVDAAEVTNVAFKSLSNGIATIRTTDAHNLSVGEQITIAGVDSVFDGTHTVLSVPNSTSFTFAQNRVPPRSIVFGSLISNIVTLTTSDVHTFVVGETVVVSGAGPNFDGTFEITAVPSPTTFSYANTRTNARNITFIQMATPEVVSVTTATPHGLTVGEPVNISDTTLTFNGGFTVAGIDTNTNFNYVRPRITRREVITKARAGNVATLTTAEPHGYVVGEQVFVNSVDSLYNGTHTITELPSATTFSYANTGSNQVSTSLPQRGTVVAASRKLLSIQLAGNIVTATTRENHGVFIGETITITGVNAELDGTYTVSAIPFLNVLEFEKTGTNIPLIEYPADEETGETPEVYVELSGSVPQIELDPPGQLEVGGSLPLSALSGTASVSGEIEEVQSGGSVIKTNNVQFTPGLTGATAVVQADILEVDTKRREVAFNGEITGARGRVDVLADFIKLAPGNNELEIIDNGNPDSETSLRVFYRSGWLS